ncbi:hypothetical protein ZIOFF_043461 [Zingiber officinale]|uniref:Uncharacterized protein n=1 Tax=Zingiber officinale TaxID=94328 RepID=A0A8J5FTC4_ZINOF|nr:hypothetical protein ZIOFF_043461 [Zingiber officinale]
MICVGKSSWPELVGVNGNKAVTIIEKENPNVDAITVLIGSFVTQDFRCDRNGRVCDGHRDHSDEPWLGQSQSRRGLASGIESHLATACEGPATTVMKHNIERKN